MKHSSQILVFSFQSLIRMLIAAGLGCSILYSTQLFDGVKTAKTFYFILIVCLIIFFLFGKALWKKKTLEIPLTLPDSFFALYAVWAFARILTSVTDSFHNVYFWEFVVCVCWYFCLRFFFFASKEEYLKKYLWFFLILLGYIQLIVCILQTVRIIPSFSPIFPVSGTFDNTSELCIYLTCILPVAVNAGLKANDTASKGKTIRAVCLFYILCWLAFVLLMGSRTALLSGFIGLGVYTGFQSGFFKYLKEKINSFPYKIIISVVLGIVIIGMICLLAQYKKDSANGRLLIWKVSWSGIIETPLQGQGFNAFQAKYGHYQAEYFQKNTENQKEAMLASNMSVAMNDFVETAFNLGFIGLFLYVAFWFSLFKRIAGQARNDITIVAIAVVVIFLVSSGFYFIERMLSVKVLTLFFAAYISSIQKKIMSYHIHPVLLKSIATIILFFCCFAGYTTIHKAKYYSGWRKANTFAQFGYRDEAKAIYEKVYPYMQHNGSFLFHYAKNLYENQAYRQCLENMEIAKPLIASSEFYSLLGDTYFKTGDYESAKIHYEYASFMVPNRFRPLYKLFKMYRELEKIQEALVIAQNIVIKPVKVISVEIQGIIKECNDFINTIEYEQIK